MENFAARILTAADRWPERTAIELVAGDRIDAMSYASLKAEAGQVAAWLVAKGMARGDRAAILANNDAHWISTYLGTLWIGAIAVPLDTAYKAPQVLAVLQSCTPRFLFTTAKYAEPARAAAASAGASAPEIVLIDDRAHFSAPAAIPAVAGVAASDAAVILYTSGTTADPKGVVLTHANLDAERAAAFSVVHVTEEDAILGVLPLFHALAQMANLLLPLSVGARVVFLETVSSSALVAALDARGISLFACVPQFFYLIHQRVMGEFRRAGRLVSLLLRSVMRLNVWLRDRVGINPGRRIFARVHRVLGSRMRVLVTGGSQFDPIIARDLYGLGFTILNAYGLTETSGAATIVRPSDRFTSSVGQALPGVEIKIAPASRGAGASADRIAAGAEWASGPHGAEAASRGAGAPDDVRDDEILIRGALVMREYFNRPDATAEAIRDGWLYTGDLGRLDDDGRLFITGRKKEIIVLSSGKNLYPEEIEAHYRQSAYIKEICILGMGRPGEPAAERLHAVIVPDEQTLRDRGIVNLRELVRFELENVSVQLPAYKRVLGYDIWLDPLPRTTTGKIRRHEVQTRLRQRATPEAAAERPLAEADREWMSDSTNAALLETVGTHVGGDKTIRPDDNLELDLGLDSMERVELLTVLEQKAGAKVSADARAIIFNVRQLVDAVRAAPAGAPSVAAGEDDLPWERVLSDSPDPALAANLAKPKPIQSVVLFVASRIFRLLMMILLRFRASGMEHLPKDGPFILSPNHQSYLDGFVLGAVLPFRTLGQLFYVGATENYQTRLMAWIGRRLNIVPVDPDANLVSAMQAGAAGLRLKKVLVLFPEGERSIDGELKKFKKGAAILGAHLDAPIVPVAMDGLYALWPRGRTFQWRQLLPWRMSPVSLRFGPPLRMGRGQYVEGTAQLRRAVETMFEAIRAERR